jgi:hypothetical protein
MICIVPKMQSVVVLTRASRDAALVGKEPATHDFVETHIRAGEQINE